MECLELWSVRLRIICHTSCKTNHLCSRLEEGVFEDALPCARKQRKTAKPRNAPGCRPHQHSESRPATRKTFLRRRRPRQRKAATRKEVSMARALWRAGKVPKPEYVQFCNRIHLRLHYFHKMQNAMLILSQDKQEKIAQKLLLRVVDVSLSRSLARFHSLEFASSLAVALSPCSHNL